MAVIDGGSWLHPTQPELGWGPGSKEGNPPFAGAKDGPPMPATHHASGAPGGWGAYYESQAVFDFSGTGFSGDLG
jgi:hypothetical protein